MADTDLTQDVFLAREFVVDVDTTPTAGTPTWVPVRFRSDVDPKIDPNYEDANTYDDGGWGRQEKTMMTWSLDFSILLYKTIGGGYAPEAELFRQAAYAFEGGKVHVRFYNSAEVHEGWAHVKWERAENKVVGLGKANISLTGAGELVSDGVNPYEDPEGDDAINWLMTTNGTPTGGTFSVTVVRGGVVATTTAITFNPSPAVLLAALEALSNVDPGDVSVGTAGGGANAVTRLLTWTVRVAMTATGTFTGGTNPNITVTPV